MNLFLTALKLCFAYSLYDINFISAVIHFIIKFILGVLSAGLASTYPTSFTYAAQYVQLTGNIAGNLSLGASLGSMILPALAGKMMETSPKDPCSILYSKSTAS